MRERAGRARQVDAAEQQRRHAGHLAAAAELRAALGGRELRRAAMPGRSAQEQALPVVEDGLF